MISGLGFTEIIVVGLIIIMFFGSEDLPKLLRLVGEYWGKIRQFTNAAKAEIDAAVKDVTPDLENVLKDSVSDKKQAIRKEVKTLISKMSESEKCYESEEITKKLVNTKEWKDALSVMLFISLKDEPDTEFLIKKALKENKRVIVPYCIDDTGKMGIAEIKDIEKDLVPGKYGIKEPNENIRDNFFISDLRLIVCPGVAFGSDCSRLGRGKAYYDRFLKNLEGKISKIGIGFTCQRREEPIPFDYHDIVMNMIVTPKDILVNETLN